LKVRLQGLDAFVRVVHFVESRITNGILEGIDSKKLRAIGYRIVNNFIPHCISHRATLFIRIIKLNMPSSAYIEPFAL
jgi:hypothetical protein